MKIDLHESQTALDDDGWCWEEATGRRRPCNWGRTDARVIAIGAVGIYEGWCEASVSSQNQGGYGGPESSRLGLVVAAPDGHYDGRTRTAGCKYIRIETLPSCYLTPLYAFSPFRRHGGGLSHCDASGVRTGPGVEETGWD